MTKKIKQYSEGFKRQVVTEYEAGSSMLSLAKKYGITGGSTIRYWVKAYESGKLGEVGKGQRELTALERELYETKRELARVRMERDILKKATAYFAKESLHGTR